MFSLFFFLYFPLSMWSGPNIEISGASLWRSTILIIIKTAEEGKKNLRKIAYLTI